MSAGSSSTQTQTDRLPQLPPWREACGTFQRNMFRRRQTDRQTDCENSSAVVAAEQITGYRVYNDCPMRSMPAGSWRSPRSHRRDRESPSASISQNYRNKFICGWFLGGEGCLRVRILFIFRWLAVSLAALIVVKSVFHPGIEPVTFQTVFWSELFIVHRKNIYRVGWITVGWERFSVHKFLERRC